MVTDPGNAGPAPLRLRPLPLSELLDELFRFYRRNFGLLASAALAVQLPNLAFQLLAGQYRTFGFMFNAFSSIGNPDALDSMAPPQANWMYYLLGLVVLIVLAPVSAGLMLRVTTDLAMGRRVTIGSAVRRTLGRYLALAAFLLLVALGVLVVAGVLFAIIGGGIALASATQGGAAAVVVAVLVAFVVAAAAFVGVAWLGVRLSVAVPAMLEEGVGPIRGIARSWTLVRGSFWRIVGILLVVYVLALAIQYALMGVLLVVAILVPGLSGDMRGGLVVVLLTLVEVLITPIWALAVTLIYFDLRVRREALDLDQLAEAVAPLPPPVTSPLPPPVAGVLPPPLLPPTA